MELIELPIEVVQFMVFHHSSTAGDVLSLALTCKTMYGKILGELGNENEYDVDQWRGVSGVVFCLEKQWWRGARLAVERGYGDPNGEVRGKYTPRTTPLVEGCAFGAVQLVRALLKVGSINPGGDGNKAVLVASQGGHVGVVTVLLADERVDPADGESLALQRAAQNGRAEVVALLIEDGRVDVNARDGFALREAAGWGYLDTVRALLVDPTLDLNVRSGEPLRKAIDRRLSDVVALLLADPRTVHDGPSSSSAST